MRDGDARLWRAATVKVVHIVRQYHPAVGGLEEAVAKLAAALAAMPDVKPAIVTLDRRFGDPAAVLPPRGEYLGVPITRIPFTGSRRYPIAPGVLRHLGDADLVHVHAVDFFFDYMALTRPVHRRPMVASTHGGFFHTEFAGRLKRLYFNSVTRASSRAYDRILGSSEADAATFGRIAPGRTIAIENGVDIAKWHDRAAPDLRPVMACIGRFSSNKAIPRLFPLLAALRAGGTPWRLIVIGQPADLTAADLMREAAAVGVTDAVEIVVGATDDAVAGLIGQASYVVSASRYEGFGLGVVEGMSAGLFPLVSHIPPFERLVATTGQGALIAFDDPAGAAERITTLHGRHGQRFAGQRAATIGVTARYGWSGVALRFADIYRDVLAKS